ncbi:hypothetical protein JCM8202_001588 [Rhodotorula sphaerocarpa]
MRPYTVQQPQGGYARPVAGVPQPGYGARSPVPHPAQAAQAAAVAAGGGQPRPPPQQPRAPPQAYAVPLAAPPPQSASATPVPPGGLPPGTVVHVGDCVVTVERFLSEGGFAHVYLATSTIPLPKGFPNATTRHVLKRMVVPDKRGVAEVGKEVEVMRQLKNHPKIVNMIEASVSDLAGGVDGSRGYEIYILMEWCQGGGIIDMMNTRLQNRLTEGEILKIFSDVVEAVAHMHYQDPPLIHRDLKVENILLSPPQTYKLCDFGSTTRPLPRDKVPTTVEGIQKIELEINKTTTLQYRAPELVDVWGRKGYDEKIDIWALGVFLYKLCFYTTPFEEHGPLAILNAQYKFPPYPAYSGQIRALIASMLQERASQRSNIYQVHEAVCKLRGVQVRLENKYAGASAVSPIGNVGTPSPASALAPPPSLPNSPSPVSGGPLANIITSAPSPSSSPANVPGTQSMYGAVPGLSGNANQIAPMRRGRPTKATASPDMQLLPERQVRTGTAALGGGSPGFGAGSEQQEKSGGPAASWDKFSAPAGENAAASAAIQRTASSVSADGDQSGFADAFAPTSPVRANASQAPDGDAGAGLETSVQLPGNADMFAKLASGDGPDGAKGGAEAASADDDDAERKRFESAFPDINSDLALLASTSRPSPAAPTVPAIERASSTTALPDSLVDASDPGAPSPVAPDNRMPMQITGEKAGSDAGPALPRRPPSAASSMKSPTERPPPKPKPTLVSRGSQTSPRLMATWQTRAPGLASGSTPDLTERSSSGKTTTSSTRQSSIPDLELFPTTDANSRGEVVSEDRKAVVDLLGDDDEDAASGGARGSGADAFLPMQVNPAKGAPQDIAGAGNVASKRSSFLAGENQQPQKSTSPTAASAGGGEREKFRPLKRSSLGQGSNGPPPIISPKPNMTAPTRDTNDETADGPDTASVEARFPELSMDDGPPTDANPPSASSARPQEQWDPVVEKEDAADSSDEEAAPHGVERSASGKPAAPDFDDDESRTPRQASASSRSASGPAPDADAGIARTASPASLQSGPPAVAAANDGPRQASFASSSSGGGGINLEPALSSIHRFAPTGERQSSGTGSAPTSPGPTSPSATSARAGSPPVNSQSRSGSIHSLVSRYQTSGLTGGPPPLGKKPVGLRKNSNDSIAKAGSEASDAAGRRDPVQPQRLPQWTSNGGVRSPVPSIESPTKPSFSDQSARMSSGGDEAPKPATPTMADRAPFKPTPPPGSPSATQRGPGYGHRSRPSFGNRATKPTSPLPSPGAAPEPNETSNEQEERFAGVSNMKSRWESMSKPSEPARGPPRNGPRKDHAAV